MPRKKQKRIDETLTLKNVYKGEELKKGEWRNGVFGNQNPIVLELACGRGYYTLELARRHQDKNFIGVDRKADRIWYGAKKALSENLENVAFLRTNIEKLGNFFEQGEVDEIWITFPDPFPKPSRSNKRLTSSVFMKTYRKILSKNSLIHLKTDNTNLFDFSLDVFAENGEVLDLNFNVHGSSRIPGILKVKTFYEQKFMSLGETIKYARLEIS